MRTLSSLLHRQVVTESGEQLGRCFDLRGELTGSSLRVTELVVGTSGLLEHLGIARGKTMRSGPTVPWKAVVRIEGDRLVVRDGTRLE